MHHSPQSLILRKRKRSNLALLIVKKKDIHLQMHYFLLAGSIKLYKRGNQKIRKHCILVTEIPKTQCFCSKKSPMSLKSQHTHFEDKIQDEVRFGGFPTTCAILVQINLDRGNLNSGNMRALFFTSLIVCLLK